MPVAPDNITKIVLEGSLGQNEVFATGWWVRAAIPPDTASLQASTDLLRTFMQTGSTGPLATLASLIDAGARYNGIRTYFYPSGASQALFQAYSPFTSLYQGSGTGSLPLQTALVATLRSATLGRRSRGRMYLPCTAQPLTGHQVALTQLQSLTAALKATFNYAQGAGGLGFATVVSFTGHATHDVTQITMDSRTDVQRRRAGKETITATASQTVP